MFEWLHGGKSGIAHIFQQFGQMLEDGRHTFDAASNALLGGTDPRVVRDDLYATDRRINELEQRIRREVAVHATVKGGADITVCLTLMSLVKDAERIGDYAKNIFDLATDCPAFHEGPEAADLVDLKNRTSRLLAKVRNLCESQDIEQSRSFVEEVDDMLSECDKRVSALTKGELEASHPVAAALLYRYIKRVLAHQMNIVSSVFMPLDKLDYFDEDKESR